MFGKVSVEFSGYALVQQKLCSQFTEYKRFGMLKSAYCGISSDGGKIVEKFIERLAAFQIVQESLERHAGAAKDRRPAKNIGIADDHFIAWGHGVISQFQFTPRVKQGASDRNLRPTRACGPDTPGPPDG
jgi:hypothetical protein